MGLDIITQRQCDVKLEIPPIELLNQIKNRNRAIHIFQMLTSNGKSQEEALNFEFSFIQQTPNGNREEKKKVSTLIQQTSFLKSLGEKCLNCPVSQNRAFGCIGNISYPISSKCEQWLSEIAQISNKKGLPFSTTIVFIKDKKINGERIKHMRANGQTFFESNQPKEILLSKGLFKRDTINSDQLLDVTFLQGVMKHTHINYLLMLFGEVVSTETKPTDKAFVIEKNTNKFVYYDLDLPNDADKSMIEFYNYFQHLFIALMNGNDVFMD